MSTHKHIIRIEIFADGYDGKICAYVGDRRVFGLECLNPYMIGGFHVDVDTLKDAIAEWEQDRDELRRHVANLPKTLRQSQERDS